MKRFKKLILIMVLCAALPLAFAGCGSDNLNDSLGKKYGPIFESFDTTDVYGNSQDESLILDSKLTLVLIWSTTCNPCIEGMPNMEALYREYKDTGFNIMGIVVNAQDQSGNPIPSTMADAVKILDTKGVTFTNTLIPKPVEAFLYEEIQYTPTAFFVDQTGTIVSELYIGEQDNDDWSDAIEELID